MNKRLTELALIRAAPDLTIGTLPHSRLGGLYTRLQREVDKDLARIRRPAQHELHAIGKRIEKFGLATGWLGGQRHVGTLLSFCAEMVENSEYRHNPRILETINLIIEHLENGKELKTVCCWAGSIAADKWSALINE